MDVTFLSFDGCPNAELARQRLAEALGLSCRIYRTGAGVEGAPSVDEFTAALCS